MSHVFQEQHLTLLYQAYQRHMLAGTSAGKSQRLAFATRSPNRHLSAACFHLFFVFVSDFREMQFSRMGKEGLARRIEWGRKFWTTTHPQRFATNRPTGKEVLDWLREQQLSSYVPIFCHHGIDTLISASNLSREQVLELVKEYTEIYSLDHEQERELHLWQAVNSLKHDPRARTLAERLEWFEDSAAAWHCRSEFTHHPLPNFCGLTPKPSRLTHTLTLTHEHTCSMGKIERRTIHGASDNLHHAILAIALESGGNAKNLCHVV